MKFIVFEGIDASGTTTQALLLEEALKKKGIDTLRTKEPCYGTPTGDLIKEYLEKKWEFSPQTLALLYAADRLEHSLKIRKWIGEGRVVITDRYLHSNMAYQGAHGVDMDWIRIIERCALKPDFVVFLRITPEEAAKRRQGKDRNEEDLSYQRKVAETYEGIKEREWFIVDATKSKEDIAESVLQEILPFL